MRKSAGSISSCSSSGFEVLEMDKRNDGHGFPTHVRRMFDKIANFQKEVENFTLTCSNMPLASIGKSSLQ